jgi:enoyl-CoA hydratase/carnithine racemase
VDRIVCSPGHYIIGPFAAAAELGLATVSGYGQNGSVFEAIGTERSPVVDYTCGSLGQGLSAALGFALADRFRGSDARVFAMVSDGEIPTIGVLNGPGFHSEIVLMCDITLAASDAVLFDLHYDIGSVPADGIHNAFQELLGVKRAAYALLTGEAITAQQALEWGMVNEVVPRERLIPRAYEIAGHIMTQPRMVRRLTTQIVRRPWKQRIVNDLDGGFGIQMFGHIAKKRAVHGQEHIASTVDYVREGRKNNFD